MAKLSYRITWVDDRDPLNQRTKTYKTKVPAVIQPKTNDLIGDASLYTADIFAAKHHDCTEHEGRFYKPDMIFVGMCFEQSTWEKAYGRFHASGVAPVRRKNRTNPYAALEFDLNVGTNADRQAIVTVYLKPLVNGKDPIQ
jgi:hypothetical protein